MTYKLFKPGDIVELATGEGPRMIVERTEPAGWTCAWSAGGNIRHGVFAPEVLRHYQKRSHSRRRDVPGLVTEGEA